jgi:preprotein translocase subunit SecD
MRNKILNWKFVAILAVSLSLTWYALPNFFMSETSLLPKQKINFGLDLRGGSQLLLKVNFESYLKDQMELTSNMVRKSLRKNKLRYSKLRANKNSVTLSAVSHGDIKKVQKILRKIDDNLDIESDQQRFTIKYSNQKLDKMHKSVLEQTREIIRHRIDETGTKEPSIQRQGDYGILLQVPGLDDPTQLKRVLGKTAKLGFHLVDSNTILSQALSGYVPSGSKLLPGDTKGSWYVIKNQVIASGDLLTDAKFMNNENGQAGVSFTFNTLGAKLFADATRNNRGKQLAIVLDDKVLSAPVVNEPILSGSGIISGNFTVASANELAMLLRAGSLPAPIEVAEEKIVGPSLGEDSITLGKKSALIGIASVMVFMVITYGIFGVFASFALAFNILFILSILTIIQATLTLPGIAGIVLTVGMAVDANVLIFERIREESNRKSITYYSIKRGFEQAFATILDSNLTTLIAAFFLYVFGSGLIKGFAVTLTIGILCSMFTAITLTKIFVLTWMHCREKTT